MTISIETITRSNQIPPDANFIDPSVKSVGWTVFAKKYIVQLKKPGDKFSLLERIGNVICGIFLFIAHCFTLGRVLNFTKIEELFLENERTTYYDCNPQSLQDALNFLDASVKKNQRPSSVFFASYFIEKKLFYENMTALQAIQYFNTLKKMRILLPDNVITGALLKKIFESNIIKHLLKKPEGRQFLEGDAVKQLLNIDHESMALSIPYIQILTRYVPEWIKRHSPEAKLYIIAVISRSDASALAGRRKFILALLEKLDPKDLDSGLLWIQKCMDSQDYYQKDSDYGGLPLPRVRLILEGCGHNRLLEKIKIE